MLRILCTAFATSAGLFAQTTHSVQTVTELTTAINNALAGDTILVDPGDYRLTTTLRIRTRGTASQPIKLLANGKPRPVIHGGSADHTAAILFQGAAHWHMRGFEIDGERIANPSNYKSGICVMPWYTTSNPTPYTPAHDILIEDCDVHDCTHTGVQIRCASRCTILNCDSHHNTDEGNPGSQGENADGFQIVYTDYWNPLGGVPSHCHSNVIYGCRAWNNADDGYDFWQSYPVTVQNCQAWNNGFPVSGSEGSAFRGDGNGFKLGQQGRGHTVIGCAAWNNDLQGFSTNGAQGPCTLINCTAYSNGLATAHPDSTPHTGLPNFLLRSQGSGGADSDFEHVVFNCLSVDPGNGNDTNSQAGLDPMVSSHNSWEISYSVPGETFELSPPIGYLNSYVAPARAADGDLPIDNLLRLASDLTDLIDVGAHVGTSRPFTGTAPDIGAYEAVMNPGNNVELRILGSREVAADLSLSTTLGVHSTSTASGANTLYVGLLDISSHTTSGLIVEDTIVGASGTMAEFEIPFPHEGYRTVMFRAVNTGGSTTLVSDITEAFRLR